MNTFFSLHKLKIALFLFLFSFCFQLGCAAQKSYKAGVQWEQQEEYYKAGQKFLFALHKKPKNIEYHTALKRVAQPAYEQGLLLARTAQNNEDFPLALSYYTELKAFTKGLKRHDLLTFEIIDIKAYIEDMSVAVAQERYQDGLMEMENGNYEEAIKNFNRARAFKENFSDSAEKIAECYYQWGERELTTGEYDKAVAQFLLSDQSLPDGYKDAKQRAADIHFSIGKYYVKKNRCQAGLEELNKAKAISATRTIRIEIAKAKSCAARSLVIVTYTNTRKDNQTGLKNQIFFTKALAEAAQPFAEANPHVYLHTTGMRSRAQSLHDHPSLAEFDRLLFVDMENVSVRRGDWKREPRSAQAKMWVRCAEADDLCQKDITVVYTEVSRLMKVASQGSLSMVTTSGSSLWNHDIDKSVSKEIRYADSFLVEGVSVNIGTQKSLGTVVLPNSINTLSKNPKSIAINTVAQEMFQNSAQTLAEKIIKRAGDEGAIPKINQLTIESSQ